MSNQNILFSAGAALTVGASIPVAGLSGAGPTNAVQPWQARTSVRPCVDWLSRWQDNALAIFAAPVDTPASWRDMLPNGLPVFEYADSVQGAELWDVLHSDRHLAIFAYFHRRPVLDAGERQLYAELLADRELLAEMRQGLMSPGEDEAVMRGCMEWSLRIDYLEAAIAWQDNPRRNELLGMIEEIIARNSFRTAMDDSQTQALTTIKLELVQLLSRHAPARLAELRDAVRGTRMAALVEFLVEHVIMSAESAADRHQADLALDAADTLAWHVNWQSDGVPEALAYMETAASEFQLAG
jgi:hypothetical protein